jgi:hypothetical protein
MVRVNPMYYVGFCTATIVASLILFKGFNTANASNTVSLLCGFIVTFLGVHILNLAMLDESAAQDLEGGVALDGGSPWQQHARRRSTGSLNGLRTPLFGAFAIDADGGDNGGAVRLQRLSEEDEDVDERTAMNGSRGSPGQSPGHHSIRIPRSV